MKRPQRVAHECLRALKHAYAAVSYARAARSDHPVPLATIMNRQGSDKGSLHGYKLGMAVGHYYTDVYEDLFGHLRNEPITMLEVGIGPTEPGVLKATMLTRGRRGGSSAGWRDYFAQGDIHAMDILDCSELDQERLTTHLGDQGSRESMAKVVAAIGKPLDIIIDDGSHQSRHQQITLACLFPGLADDGIYVIEDLDWQPPEPADMPKTVDLLRELQGSGTFKSPVLSEDECADIERTVVVESIIDGEGRLRGTLAVLRKRREGSTD